jgi:Ca2+-binding EF-hand superfamily protein
MFSLTRRRREAERNKKLEDVFREADANGNGKITQEQMIKIFEVNDCAGMEYD